MTRKTLDQIEVLAVQALIACGASAANAASVARAVRRAEADDLGAVGLGYLPTYLAHLRSGKVDGQATPVLSQSRAAAWMADAANGFAHPAYDAALPHLVASARSCGCAGLGIRRSYSIGVLGHPVEDIALQGLVGMAFTNSPPNMAPWGGKHRLFGTNPLALAAPRRERPPLVIDQATSAVTKVALTAAARAGGPIAAGWALDREGRPTEDAQAALAGSIAPFGGAKGAAMALIVEILAAALTGANFSKDASPYASVDGPPPGVGQWFIALEPEAFSPGFLDRIEDLAKAMLSQDGVRLPGDRRLAARERARAEGVDVDGGLLAQIDALTQTA
jgi:(2R)-3-sulfolactate dehydrogenase (NADP+)